MLDARSGVRLTPLYDVMSTVFYRDGERAPRVDTTLGLHVARTTDIDAVSMRDVVAEAELWGMRRRRATALVGDLLERLPYAVLAATGEVPDVPDDLVQLVTGRVQEARADLIA